MYLWHDPFVSEVAGRDSGILLPRGGAEARPRDVDEGAAGGRHSLMGVRPLGVVADPLFVTVRSGTMRIPEYRR